MSDLISRKELLNELKNENSPYETIVNIEDTDTTQDIINKTLTEYRKILKDMVNNQPTAYDVEKVVSELKSHNNTEKMATVKLYNGEHRYYRAVSVTKAIKIVKGGGVE